MSDMDCGTARELGPDFVAGELAAADAALVEAHLVVCEDCRAEIELVRLLIAGRASVPDRLPRRVMAAVRADRVGTRRPWWGISAAAVAALALGIGISSGPSDSSLDVPGYAYEVEEGELWLADDGLVAGAPSLDALSDEALETLLDELAAGSAGGAA